MPAPKPPLRDRSAPPSYMDNIAPGRVPTGGLPNKPRSDPNKGSGEDGSGDASGSPASIIAAYDIPTNIEKLFYNYLPPHPIKSIPQDLSDETKGQMAASVHAHEDTQKNILTQIGKLLKVNEINNWDEFTNQMRFCEEFLASLALKRNSMINSRNPGLDTGNKEAIALGEAVLKLAIDLPIEHLRRKNPCNYALMHLWKSLSEPNHGPMLGEPTFLFEVFVPCVCIVASIPFAGIPAAVAFMIVSQKLMNCYSGVSISKEDRKMHVVIRMGSYIYEDTLGRLAFLAIRFNEDREANKKVSQFGMITFGEKSVMEEFTTFVKQKQEERKITAERLGAEGRKIQEQADLEKESFTLDNQTNAQDDPTKAQSAKSSEAAPSILPHSSPKADANRTFVEEYLRDYDGDPKTAQKMLIEFYDTDTKFNGTDRAVEFGEFNQRISGMIGLKEPDLLQNENSDFIDALAEFRRAHQPHHNVATKNRLFQSCAAQEAAARRWAAAIDGHADRPWHC